MGADFFTADLLPDSRGTVAVIARVFGAFLEVLGLMTFVQHSDDASCSLFLALFRYNNAENLQIP